ncbi:alpha/beta hydrolase [Anabaena sp. FACHB-1237]|uniref:alpha/beta hydrolase n=1 Tax=Anabaena sp. FACHB-1237 TaxID=2692769 RepID=UPI0016810381|nr:alpha/beta hydrolase [Anabaena sp. FACHB-1237]MBD2137030.1 alpha/beta hydrolase [Anabaena sp. FACHB-1237]
MNQTLEFIKFPAQTEPQGLVITLHGWGADANDVASLFPYFKLPNYQFIFPHAPYAYPYNPSGKAWYDLRAENIFAGLSESRQLLIDWLLSLENETGIPLNKTILSGFSQGGAMTLDVGLNLPLAGLVVMSGYLHPSVKSLETRDFPPTLIMHGTQDQVVPLEDALKAKEVTEKLGVKVEYHEFEMGHEISLEMLNIFRNFVVKSMI